MLFTGLGRSVLGETVPSVWVPPSAYGLGWYLRPRAVSPNTDRPRPVNNIYSMLICGKLVQVLSFCIARVKLCLTVIAVRIMAGSYVQLIIMHNFGKFQPGMLVLIIWQRHIAICFSQGLGFHCLHTISNTCIFWVNIVPTSGSTNHLKIPSQNKILY